MTFATDLYEPGWGKGTGSYQDPPMSYGYHISCTPMLLPAWTL